MLIYRKPGEQIVSKKGGFQENDWSKEGFIVSTHDGQKSWYFVESKTESHAEEVLFTESPLTYTKKEYLRLGHLTLEEIRKSKLQKFVLSRIDAVVFDEKKSLALFHLICESYPNAFVYYFEDTKIGKWIGASPELLISKKNSAHFTKAIAGTKLHTEVESWGSKEREEQLFVTDFILERLCELKVGKISTKGPFDWNAGPIKHLCTEIDFESKVSSEKIVKALHPTPAVLGLPFQEGVRFRSKIERHQRDLYSGYIGLYGQKSMNLYVNIRCCRIVNSKMYLYLGGGYTSESDPEKEWQETENKKRTFTELFKLL